MSTEKKPKIAKYSLEQIKQIFLLNNCELLSDNYKNNRDILRFKCKCDVINELQLKKYLVQLCCNDCHRQTLKKKNKYKFEEVKEIFEKNDCELLSTEYINQNVNLNYICECKNEAKISFKAFLNGQRCQKCQRERTKITNLEIYGNEVSMNSEELKKVWVEKVKNRTEEEKQKIEEKRKQTNVEKYGKEYILQLEEIKERGKQTNIEKYGKEYTLQVEEIRERGKQTMIEKYGVEHPLQNEQIKEQVKQTNVERYGVECPLQNEQIKEQIKQTNLERYGVEYVSQSPEIQERIKQTNLERYGFEYACQNAEVQEKIFKYRMKKYTLPSGKEINIQGYENHALDILLKNYNEDQIFTQKTDMPIIRYKFESSIRRYFPDIYIPSENKIIEVKSTWTYKKNLIQNIFKALETRKLGFCYEIWIIDNEKLINII